MENHASVGMLSAFAPLRSKFGDRLTLRRDGSTAVWSFDGYAAIVELRPEGAIHATFVERPAREAVSGVHASAVYRSSRQGYTLAADGCARMVADMAAFFSGAREPRFTFAALRGIATARS